MKTPENPREGSSVTTPLFYIGNTEFQGYKEGVKKFSKKMEIF